MNEINEHDASSPALVSVSRDEVARWVASFLYRKLRLVVPLLAVIAGASGWAFDQLVEHGCNRRVDAEISKILSIHEQARQELGAVKSKNDELTQSLATITTKYNTEVGRMREVAARVEEAEKKALEASRQIDAAKTLLAQAQELKKQITASMEVVNLMKKDLERNEEYKDLKLDVDKIVASLKRDVAFQKQLTAGVDAKIGEVEDGLLNLGRSLEVEQGKRLEPLEESVARLQSLPGIQGVPYHALPNGSDNCADIHSALEEKRERGKVHYDQSGLVQFWRLSSSVSHNGETPRCHARFQGWLPERAFAGSLPKDHLPAQLELPGNLSAEDVWLRDQPEPSARPMAEFSSGTIFFTTGQRKNGWVEVMFDGWVPLEIRPSGRKLVEPIEG